MIDLRIPACALALLAAAESGASYNLTSDATTRNGTAIAVDGKCNLTEALASVNKGSPINTDCVNVGPNQWINLDAPSGTPVVYQLAAGATYTTSTSTGITTPSEYMAVIEAPGNSVFTINANATVNMSYVILRHKAGTKGRVLTNLGTFSGYTMVFQDGDATDLGNGGGIYNTGTITDFYDCKVKNNRAPNGSGGGIYNRGFIRNEGIENSVIAGNMAAQGGGIYSVKPSGSEGQLSIYNSSIYDNKAIAKEVTAGGTVSSGGGNACGASETHAQAFDDNFNTKWCASAFAPPAPASPFYAIYQFAGGAKVRVQSYAITSANDSPQRDPSDWTLAGSNTAGGPWTTLDTRTGKSFTIPYAFPAGQWGRHLTRSFYFNNSTAYAYYRFSVSKNVGSLPASASIPGSGTSSNLVQLAEIQLFEDRKTGDGGGVYYNTHANFVNSTISRNIAGCVNTSCACPVAEDWCANATNTHGTYGRGGGIYAADYTAENGNAGPGETLANSLTVAGNSASQGGGFYQAGYDHWAFSNCIFGNNKSRTNVAWVLDFLGNPHTPELFGRGGSLFSNQNGLVTTNNPGEGLQGYRLTGSDPDKHAVNPGLRALAPLWAGSELKGNLLLSTSAAYNAVPTNTAGPSPSRDQRFLPRPTASFSDFGSIERQSTDP